MLHTRKNIITCLIVLIIGISCKRAGKKIEDVQINHNEIILDSIYKVEKLDSTINYEPLSLNFKGNPIFSIGQKLTEIDSTLSYRIDPNMDYQDYFPLIQDYMTTEDRLSVYKIGKHSHIMGVLYFSVDQNSQRIFNVSGTWGFNVYKKEVLKQMELWLTESLFPNLKNKFKFEDKWSYKIESPNQIELFNLSNSKNNWSLDYKVELK